MAISAMRRMLIFVGLCATLVVSRGLAPPKALAGQHLTVHVHVTVPPLLSPIYSLLFLQPGVRPARCIVHALSLPHAAPTSSVCSRLQTHISSVPAQAFAVESLQKTSEVLGFNYTLMEFTHDKWKYVLLYPHCAALPSLCCPHCTCCPAMTVLECDSFVHESSTWLSAVRCRSNASAWNATGILAQPNNVLWNYKLGHIDELYPTTSGCTACGFGTRVATIWADSYTLVTTMTQKSPDDWGFLEPIDQGVWRMLAVCALTFAIVFYLVELQGPACPHSKNQITASVGGFFQCCYYAFSSFFGFGDYTPRTTLGRLLVCGWSFLVTIMVATYTANVSTLCVCVFVSLYLCLTVSVCLTVCLSDFVYLTVCLCLTAR